VPIHPGAQRYYSELEMQPGTGNPDQPSSTTDQPANP